MHPKLYWKILKKRWAMNFKKVNEQERWLDCLIIGL